MNTPAVLKAVKDGVLKETLPGFIMLHPQKIQVGGLQVMEKTCRFIQADILAPTLYTPVHLIRKDMLFPQNQQKEQFLSMEKEMMDLEL